MSTWRLIFEVEAKGHHEAERKIRDKLPFMLANRYVDHGSGLIISLEEVVEREPLTELEEMRAEVTAYREAFTAMAATRQLERFHCLKGIKDDLCPCCGSPIKVVEGPLYPGETSPHGTSIPPDTIRLVPRA